MIKHVQVTLNMQSDDSSRSNEHVGSQYFVSSLADVPATGDYYMFWGWNANAEKHVQILSKVVGRRIQISEQPPERSSPDDVTTYYVTLMLKRAVNDLDFRP